jgi:hypothetical protein
MMKLEGDKLRHEFETAFGIGLTDFTPVQMMCLVKFAKHIRGRCRNNAALRLYLERNFKHLKFEMVMRTWQGKEYEAMQITERKPKPSSPPAVEGSDEENE